MDADPSVDRGAEPGGTGPGRSFLWRTWLKIPETYFRILGAAVFFGFFGFRLRAYARDWPRLGYWYVFADGRRIDLPWVQVAIDVTLLMVAIGYCVRRPAQRRAVGFTQVVIPLIAAFWPMLPFLGQELLAELRRHADWHVLHRVNQALGGFLAVRIGLSFMRYAFGLALIVIGNGLDIWSYFALRRAVAIVPEARELVTRGPYRWIRHPVYLGQIMAQAGVWLVLRPTGTVQVAFFVTFVVMQLYRARLEDRTLAAAFGDDYRKWHARTFWFY